MGGYMKKYLITGADGQVGSQLVSQLKGQAEVLASDRETLDITNRNHVLQIVHQFRPDFIINAAAYTAVDKAVQKILRLLPKKLVQLFYIFLLTMYLMEKGKILIVKPTLSHHKAFMVQAS